MAIKSAGRVSIRVLPDSTGFRRDLKKALDRIEKSVRAKIPVDLVLDNNQLAEIKRKIEALKVTLRPDIKLHVSPEQLAKVKAQIERLDPKVNVNLSTAQAAAQIQALTRTRNMTVEVDVDADSLALLQERLNRLHANVNVDVDSAGTRAKLAALTRPRKLRIDVELGKRALANLTAKIAALAGLNVLGDTFRMGSEFLTNIDRMTVQAAKMGLLISGIASSVVTILGNVMVAGSELLKIGNLAWLAPGFMTSAAIGIAVTAVALADMKERLKDLGPQLETLKKQIQDDFWGEAEAPIRSMFDNIYPRLFATEGRKNTATEMGKFFGEIAASIERNLPDGLLETMFDRMNDAIGITREAINPLMHAFITMGEIGSRYFERFASWIVKISTQFDNFVTKSAGNGDMERWIEGGIQSLKDLGSLVVGTVRIFSSLTDAFRESGAKGLGDWAKGFNDTADAMNRPEFKDPLVAFFKAMRVGSDGIIAGFKNMGGGLSSFVQNALPPAMEQIGKSFEHLGLYFGDILDNGKFQKGFEDLFTGIRTGIDALAPAVKPFADSLGGVMSLMGKVGIAVGNLLATFTTEWSPVFDKLAGKLETLIDPLSESLDKAIRGLTPLLDSLVTNVAGPLIDLIRESLLPLFDSLVEKLPALDPLLKSIGTVIRDGVAPVIDSLTAMIERMDVKDLEGIFASMGSILEDTLIPLLNTVKEILDNLTAEKLKGELESIKKILDTIHEITKNVASIIENSGWTDREIEPGSKLDFSKYEQLPKGQTLPLTPANTQKMVEDVNIFKRIWDDIWGTKTKDLGKELEKNIDPTPKKSMKEKFGGWLNGLFNFDKLNKDLKEGWDYTPKFYGGGTGFSVPRMKELTALQQFHKDWDGFWSDISTNWGKFWEDTGRGWDGFWSGLGEGTATQWEGIKTTVNTKSDEIGTGLSEWWTGVTEGWNGFWTDAGTWASTTWDDLKTNVSTKSQELGTGLSEWWTGVSDGWNGFWGDVGTTVSTKWDEMKTWVGTKSDEMGTGLASFAEDTKTNWNSFWGDVGTTVSTKWDEMKTWVNTKSGEISTNLGSFAQDTKTNWNSFWGDVATNTSTKWEEIKGWVNTKSSEIGTNINNFMTDSKTNISNGWEGAKTTTQTAWDNMGSIVNIGVDDAIAWVRTLPDRAASSLMGLDGTLVGSGQALVRGFAAGMESMIDTARTKAAAVVAAVKAYFPNSPAKEGPFSGRGYTSFSGQALVKDFAGGMMSNMNLARNAAEEIAKAANPSSQFDLASDLGDQGISIDRRHTEVRIYNPVAEPSSKTISTASNRLTMRKK